MILLETINRAEIKKEEWDAFANLSDEAWLWHRFDFIDTMLTWPGYHDLSFALRDTNCGGQIVAIAPLYIIKGKAMKVISSNYLNLFGGVACRNDMAGKRKKNIWDRINVELMKYARLYNAREINISCSPMTPVLRGESCPRINPLLDFCPAQNNLTQAWVIDLRPGIDEIYRLYADHTKQELAKAKRHDFEIVEAKGIEDADSYYKLHRETYIRTGERPHPFKYFQSIFDKLLPAGLSRIVFFKDKGKIIAANNTGLYKKGCMYWTGASVNEKCGFENRVLFHDQICFAKNNGFEWYESGEAFPNMVSGKTKGLNNFKRSFGGKLYPYYKGKIEAHNKIFKIANLIKQITAGDSV